MSLPARQLYFEAVKVGDELPPLVKPPIDRIQIARYAGASLDFSPLYVDEQFARNSGFPSALAPSMLAMAFLGELVLEWLRGARLRRFSARFVKIVWPGDVLTCRGRVVERRFEEPGRYLADIEVWAENQRGELVVRGLVGAQLYYNAEDELRQRAGQPPLVVTAQDEAARLAKAVRPLPVRREPPSRPAPARAGAIPAKPSTPPKVAARPVPSRPAAARSAPKPAARAAAPARHAGKTGRRASATRAVARPPKKAKAARGRSAPVTRKRGGKKRR